MTIPQIHGQYHASYFVQNGHKEQKSTRHKYESSSSAKRKNLQNYNVTNKDDNSANSWAISRIVFCSNWTLEM